MFFQLWKMFPVQDKKSLWMEFFNFAHTHPLGGVDVPFVVYEVRPTEMADCWP